MEIYKCPSVSQTHKDKILSGVKEMVDSKDREISSISRYTR